MTSLLALEPEAFVRKLSEFAAMILTMREHLRMTKVWLRDPGATQRAYLARHRATQNTEETVELLRAVTRDLETMGAA